MKGKNAKNMTSTHWQTDQIVWWKGSAINRQGREEFMKKHVDDDFFLEWDELHHVSIEKRY